MAMRRLILAAPSDVWGPLPPHTAVSPPRRSRAAWRWLERLLLIVGTLALGYYVYAQAESYLYQRYENRELDAILASRTTPPARDASGSTPASAPSAAPRPQPVAGAAIGRVEIPRLGVSAVVRSGSDARTLRLAVGHIPGTAFPGDVGNVGLAGHRDTFFRRLRDIETGDEIRMTTPDGVFSYRVERTDIVNPEDVWVLDHTPHPALTLVTCYPFNYIGSAPQRFIVRAALSR
jgi:sortase A